MQRRLAAILAADVVGYSRLMEADEEGTLLRLKVIEAEVIEPALEGRRGRIVKRIGDGYLLEFESVVDSLEAAWEWQEALGARAAPLLPEEAIRFRIGINLGDVIVMDDGDIFGEGVNIAARLEECGDPGGICLSGQAYDQVRNKLPDALTFRFLGHHRMKNITDPVPIYKSGEGAQRAESTTPSEDKTERSRPAVAVLPFINLSGEPEQEYFADGLTEDIISALSAWRYFPVVSRHSAFHYKEKFDDLQATARALKARYLLEGSVRRAGERVRVSVQLIDASADQQLWAERFDRVLNDIFDVQDEVTARIAATLAPELERAEAERTTAKHPDSFNAWDYYQRGAHLLFEFTKAGNKEARRMFEKAIEAEAGYSKAYTGIAYSHHRDLFWNYAPDRREASEKFLAAAQKAVALDDTDSSAHLVLGYAYIWMGNYDLAVAEEERAVSLHPANAFARVALGEALDLSGHPDDAVPHIIKGLELNFEDPRVHTFIGALARAYLNGRQYEEAVRWGRKALERRPDYPQAQLYLASALGHLGRDREAADLLARCERSLPGFALAYRNEADSDHFLAGLRRAGWTGRVDAVGILTKT